MGSLMRAVGKALGAALCLSIISCGGGGSYSPPTPPIPPSGSNVATVIVDAGPTLPGGGQLGTYNEPFVSVTVCVPATPAVCDVIDHVLVDTGSYGLRILASSFSKVALPLQMDATGNSLAECAQFADGYSWGPVVLANMQIAGESATNLPIQVIGDSRLTTIPSDCSSAGMEEDTVELFGANGVIGIGPFSQDCPGCSQSVVPGTYYACPATGACTGVTVNLAQQVVNPVTFFPVDNNGEIIQFPSVANAGAFTSTGSITFGVDTQTNNVSGTQTVLNVDAYAYMSMTFNGTALPSSFIDSGSNSINFNTASLPACTGNLSIYYCPQNTVTGLAVTLQGLDLNGNAITGQTTGATFSVASAQVQLNGSNSALPALAGTNPLPNSFDYGFPFFYGRRVAVVVYPAVTTRGTGPYFAF